MNGSLIAVAALTLGWMPGHAADYSQLPARLEPVIRAELRDWDIGGVAVALIDDQTAVYAAGFGEAKADSVFRCGSISKLFNAVAVLQQVEAGKLDLDAPVSQYGEGLLPINPFPDQPAVTLRQLLCHRSGVQRESAVGGYLDPSEPSLAATVGSVASAVQVTRPGEKTRYSNIGPSIAGRVVERVTGQSFSAYQRERILGPLGMADSHWERATLPPDRLVVSHLRVADGRGGWKHEVTPVFDLGTIPAGNLYTTAGDLARFVQALAAGGRGLVRPETLAEMWRPQLTTNAVGFGLGFAVGRFRDHRTVSHSGAVYGHSSSLVYLPAEKLGVVILANEDIANGRVRRMSRAALNFLLEAKLGEAPPPEPATVETASPAEFAGDYESTSFWARLEVRDGRLIGDLSGQPARFTARGPLEFVVDTRLDDAAPVIFERDGEGRILEFTYADQRFQRARRDRPPLPPEWRSRLGVYGQPFIPVVLYERWGRLYATTENMVDYVLTPVNRQVCAFPPGLYLDEQVVFLPGPDGQTVALDFANMIQTRRPEGRP
jgi:CubicO group peptidase (beta-lactamase class C family)